MQELRMQRLGTEGAQDEDRGKVAKLQLEKLGV